MIPLPMELKANIALFLAVFALLLTIATDLNRRRKR